jgi:hypothetical protein
MMYISLTYTVCMRDMSLITYSVILKTRVTYNNTHYSVYIHAILILKL